MADKTDWRPSDCFTGLYSAACLSLRLVEARLTCSPLQRHPPDTDTAHVKRTLVCSFCSDLHVRDRLQ